MRRVSPALVGSLALHAGVVFALMFSWSRELTVGSVVPVTIVANAPDADIRPAIQGPEDLSALAETPVPDAPPESAPPAPEPTPTPPLPTPKKAAPAPAPKKAVAPPKKAPAKPAEKTLDLDALLGDLAKPTGRPSSAAKGPSRAETAQVARDSTGSGLAGAATNGLVEDLQRRWNPNCTVEGGRQVVVRVTFTIGSGGQLIGDVTSQITSARTAVSQAAAERAERAVYAAVPFRNLPRNLYGQRINVNFIAAEACRL